MIHGFSLSLRSSLIDVEQHDFGSEVLFEAALSCEYLTTYASHMVSMPVAEEGGVAGWSASAKVEELTWCVFRSFSLRSSADEDFD